MFWKTGILGVQFNMFIGLKEVSGANLSRGKIQFDILKYFRDMANLKSKALEHQSSLILDCIYLFITV